MDMKNYLRTQIALYEEDKKEEVCGAACFMAAEIKFSKDVRPSVRLWTESCPICIFNNTYRIHFIFAHLIKQLQEVCHL